MGAMGSGSGFGKVIMFNEHFVVYGIPAIASAIDSKTEAIVERLLSQDLVVPSGREGSMAGDGWVLEDNRPANPGYKAEKFAHQKESLERVFAAAGFDPSEHNIRITLGGDLKAVGGVGASAAVCVSVARALNDEFELGFDDERVNEIAYEGEKAYAGTPSGIDNTASTFGGLLWFVKDLSGGANRIDRLSVDEPMRIVMGNTGITANTKAAVAGVKERMELESDKYSRIFSEAERLAGEARGALEEYNLGLVGRLMDTNHRLLQEVEVSHPKLDELVSTALDAGALGAKMTGGGLGGYMVALTPTRSIQDEVAGAMEAKGYEALRTAIGV
jgi:mevalonate kinase